jgi:hypothetical protein
MIMLFYFLMWRLLSLRFWRVATRVFGVEYLKRRYQDDEKRLPLSFVNLYYYLILLPRCVCVCFVSVTGLASDKLGWVFLFMFVFSVPIVLWGYYQLVMYWIIFVLSYLDWLRLWDLTVLNSAWFFPLSLLTFFCMCDTYEWWDNVRSWLW